MNESKVPVSATSSVFFNNWKSVWKIGGIVVSVAVVSLGIWAIKRYCGNENNKNKSTNVRNIDVSMSPSFLKTSVVNGCPTIILSSRQSFTAESEDLVFITPRDYEKDLRNFGKMILGYIKER